MRNELNKCLMDLLPWFGGGIPCLWFLKPETLLFDLLFLLWTGGCD